MRPPLAQQQASRGLRLCVIAAATIGLCWPAIENRFPILAPDVLGYLSEGPPIWRAILGHGNAFFTPGRPEMYSAVIHLVNWGWSPWPGLLLQAAMTAWVLWLVVRTLSFARPLAVYAVMMLVLCAATALPWTVSWPMPDILGPLAYLAAGVLVFAAERISRAERWELMATGCWAVASHSSHLLVAGALCAVLGALWLERRRGISGAGVVAVGGMIAVAALLQMGLHQRILGKASIGGKRPPYLMARVIADGPGREYLRQHCASLPWVLCRYQARLTDDADQFLWYPDGVWTVVSEPEQEALRREEMPLVWGSLREHPRMQLHASWRNFMRQLQSYRVDAYPGRPWLVTRLAVVLPQYSAPYARTLQIDDALPLEATNRIWMWALRLSLGAGFWLCWSLRRDRRMMQWMLLTAFVVILNAAVTGVLSGPSPRYESRVLWMVVSLAVLSVARLAQLKAHAAERS